MPVTGSSSSEMLLEDAALSRDKKRGLGDFARHNKPADKLRDGKGVVNGNSTDGGNGIHDAKKSESGNGSGKRVGDNESEESK